MEHCTIVYEVRKHSLKASLVEIPSNNKSSLWMGLHLFVYGATGGIHTVAMIAAVSPLGM